MQPTELGKVIRLVILAVGVCGVAGTIIGTLAWLAVVAFMAGDARAVLFLPAALPYAFLTVGSFGVVAGLVAGASMVLLGEGVLRGRSVRAWEIAGAGLGSFAGAICPLFLLLGGWGPMGLVNVLIISGCAALSGCACGGFLGRIGWEDYGAPA